MDWFSVTSIKEKPTEETKGQFNKVINEITTAKQQMYHKKIVKDIPSNKITKKVKWDFEYSNRVDALVKLESLHIEKQACEQLIEMAYCRACELNKEIHKIEDKFIEPQYVNYITCSFPKRTYEVQGNEYTTYRGTPKFNGPFFAAIGLMVACSFLF